MKNLNSSIAWLLCAGFIAVAGLTGCSNSEDELPDVASNRPVAPGGSPAGDQPADPRAKK